MPTTWFITGTSKGFGRIWAEAALERGDKVAATARRVETLSDLADRHGDAVLPIALDVTDKAAVDAAVAQAHDHFGRLDVIVNNAGYGLFGTVEEVTEEQARAQIETNVFGALWVTKAALPYLREQGSGHIVQVSSIAGVHAFPTLGIYHASKWALEGFTSALDAEVRALGIRTTLVEPIGYTTDWSTDSSVRADPLPVYEEIHKARKERGSTVPQGDPEATADAILKLVDSDDPPTRLFLGSWALDAMKAEYAKRIEIWEGWNDVSQAAHGK